MAAPPVNLSLKDSLNDQATATGGTIWAAPVNVKSGSDTTQLVIGVVSSIIAVILLRRMGKV